MKYLDASIILATIIPDSNISDICKEIMDAIESDREHAVTSVFTITEVYYVLEREFKTKKLIETKIKAVLDLKGLEIVNLDVGMLAGTVELATQYKVDLIDAINIKVMNQLGIKTIYSLDSDYDRFREIKRLACLKI